MKGNLLPRTRTERLVSGLRDYAQPSDVKVYSATTGELLRIEHANGEKVIFVKPHRRKHD